MTVKLIPINYAFTVNDVIEGNLAFNDPGDYTLIIQGFPVAKILKDQKKGKWSAVLTNPTGHVTASGLTTMAAACLAALEGFKKEYANTK